VRYGIRCTLPPDEPMAAPHLLGPDWVAHYWYATAAERDAALADMAAEHRYSRRGDAPTVIYTPIESDQAQRA
jgi:hypothetical protein